MEPTEKTGLKNEVKQLLTIRLEPSIVTKIDAIRASDKATRSQTIRRAVLSFFDSEGKEADVRKSSFAEAVYEALMKEIESGKLLSLEDPKTGEKIRVLIPVLK